MHVRIQLDSVHFYFIVKHEYVEEGEPLFDQLRYLAHADGGALADYVVHHSLDVFLRFRLLEPNTSQQVLHIINIWQLFIQLLHLFILLLYLNGRDRFEVDIKEGLDLFEDLDVFGLISLLLQCCMNLAELRE